MSFDTFLEESILQRRRLFALGKYHRDLGIPRDLSRVPHHNGTPLRWYLEAYVAGYTETPQQAAERAEFARVEETLARMPTGPIPTVFLSCRGEPGWRG